MNFLQLAQRAKSEAELAGPVPTAVATATGNTLRLVNALADAWTQIQLLPFGWRWMRAQALGDIGAAGGMQYTIDALLSVSAGTTRFAKWAPETWDYCVTAYVASNPAAEWNLQWLPYEQFRSLFLVRQHVAGPPTYWSVANNGDMLIGPTPDASYKLRADYFKSPQSLALDADVPECPSQYHMAIVWKALASRGTAGAEPETVARAVGHYSEIEAALIRDQATPITITALSLA